MFCQHNLNDNVGQKNWAVCSLYLQVYFQHETPGVLMLIFFYLRQNINAEYVILLEKKKF